MRRISSSSTMTDGSYNELTSKLKEFSSEKVFDDESITNMASPSQMMQGNDGSNASHDDIDDGTFTIDNGSTHSHDDFTLKRSDSSNSISYIDLNKLIYIPDFDFGLGLETVGDSTKKTFNTMKTKTKQKFNKYSHHSKELTKLHDLLNQRLSKFDQRIHKNLQSSTTEKLFYALAVFMIATGGFIIGKYPTYFHIFHTVLFIILMPIRFYSYFKQSWQYYLADLCYYVNLLLMIFIWWAPNSKSLFISVFSLSLGTLSFAVITWRNSLVLHSIEKTTSSFIHIMPPITMFVMVHELPLEFSKQRFPALQKITHWNFFNGIIITSIYYTVWQVTYHYFITIRRKKEIDNGRVTSFTTLKQKNKGNFLGKFVDSLPYNWMQIMAFTLIQFFYQLLTMTFCPLWFKYKHLCGGFVTFVFVWASYNGATYYIDVFGKRFEKEVNKLKLEINDLQAKIESQSTSPILKPNDSSVPVIDEQEVSKPVDSIGNVKP